MELLSHHAARFTPVPAPAPISAPLAKRTIFLVQQSSRLGNPVKTALVEKGYEVIHAESVEGALRIWASLARRVDLFLADISLGRDQGVERLVKLLQAENPRMRVLYANDLDATGPVVMQTYPKQLVAVIENCLG